MRTPIQRGRLRSAVLAVLLALSTAAAPAAADPPTDSPDTAARYAAGWVARHLDEDGAAPGFGGGADVGATVDAALALAAADAEPAAFARAVAFVEANAASYVGSGADANPGALGKVALLADAAGLDATAFGPDDLDLLAGIEATRQDGSSDDPGRYGVTANGFAQVTLQSYALLALAASGASPDPSAVTWLLDQRCASGGWAPYRTPNHVQTAGHDCTASVSDGPDPDDADEGPYTPDTNSTALAVQALVALDTGDAAVDAALAWLASVQEDDGGFAFEPGAGFGTDANSTALVIQAIEAAGGDVASAPWKQSDGDTPATALLAFQLGCDASGLDRGALQAFGAASAFATFQGTWGLAQLAFPFADRTPVDQDAATVVPCPVTSTRHAGDTRIGTSIALAQGWDAADTVVLATSDGHADALAGAPLANHLDAPLLLTPPTGLTDALVAEIGRLGATHAVLLGGTAALSAQVETDLRTRAGVADVRRVQGPDRFGTAAAILGELGTDAVYVVEGADPDPGRGWADALAVASLAAFEGHAIVLVTTDEVPAATAAALDGVTTATVVGGPLAVSEAVRAEAEELVGSTVERVAGEDRYATALAVAERAVAAGADPTDTFVATGRSPVDALAAGPRAARAGGVLLLTDGASASLRPATQRYVERFGYAVTRLHVVGGPVAVTAGVEDALLEAVIATHG